MTSRPASTPVEERRAVFRIGVAGALLNVEIDGELDCALLDANSEGFGFVSDRLFAIGQHVCVVIRHEDHTYAGRATIRNARAIDPDEGRCRYGAQTDPGEDELRRGLRKLATQVQRDRLRRRAERRR